NVRRLGPFARLRRREELDLVAPREGCGGLGAGPRELGGRAGEREGPAEAEVAVDPLARGDLADLAHRGPHRSPHRPGCGCAVLRRDRLGRGRQERRAPPAVAPRGAEARDVRLEDEHAQPGVAFREVVRGPQAREACADDDDVDLGVRVEGRGRGERGAGGEDLVEPERAGADEARLVAWSWPAASVSTPRRICSSSSNSAAAHGRGGASWTTGSPRSSARQYSPAS